MIKDDVNILIAPELSTAEAIAVLGPIVEEAENNNKDVIADRSARTPTTSTTIKAQVPDNDRIIFCAPGIEAFDAAANDTR